MSLVCASNKIRSHVMRHLRLHSNFIRAYDRGNDSFFSLLLFDLMTSFEFNCCNFTCQSYIFSKCVCNIVYVETESLWLSILVYGFIHCNHFWHHLLHIKMVKLTEMWKATEQSFMLNKENDSIYHLSCYIHFTNNNSTFFLNRTDFSEDQRQCSYSL